MYNLASPLNQSPIGCRIQLNPNGSDLRCGDIVNNLSVNNLGEIAHSSSYIKLCPMCQLRKENIALIEAINQSKGGDHA